MTQPPFEPSPFDQYGRPVRPVDYPPAQPQPPRAHYPDAQYPNAQYPPLQPMYPGQMRGVDQHTTALARPGVVLVAFVFWVLAAMSWPVGTIVRAVVEGSRFGGFGPVMTLFFTGCLAVAGVWGAVSFLGGSYQARVGLCGVSMVIGVLALAAAIVAAREGDTEPLSWAVIVLRLVLPAVAAVFSFLPGTRHFFAGNTA